jgi:hypothetical protein
VNTFVQRHHASVTGVLSGFDRLRFRGTLRLLARTGPFCYFLQRVGVKVQEFGRYMLETTKKLQKATEETARQADRPICFVAKPSASKEEIALGIARREKVEQGLVCVLKCVEPCWGYGVRSFGQPVIQSTMRKCLHYYHYFIDPDWGLMHVRLQSWMPFGIHVCVNGREWLARQMHRQGLRYVQADNCFTRLADPVRAQEIMDGMLQTDWAGFLEALAHRVNPVHQEIFATYPQAYYWTLEQSEWATDLMFKNRLALARVYPDLLHHGMLALGGTDVLRFLGHGVQEGWPHRWFKGQVSTDLRTWVEGTRIKHRVNDNHIKMYDKQGSVLRIETTINQPRNMKVYRPKEGDPQGKKAWRGMRKGVADVWRRGQVCQAANDRYLKALATVHHPARLGPLLEPLCQPVTWSNGKSQARPQRARGLNPLAAPDVALLTAVNRGDFTITGFRNRDLRALLYGSQEPDKTIARRQAAAITRKLRLLRAHGLIRKIPKTHRYLINDNARVAITALLHARQASAAKLAAVA